MKQSKLDSILGHSKGYDLAMKDSDGDKLINILDCQPYNKKKQGLVHDIAARFGKGRVGEWGREGQADSESRRQARSEARQVKRDEYIEQEKRFAKEKARIDTDRRIERYKKGNSGFFNVLASQAKQATYSMRTQPSRKLSKKERKMMRKVGKSGQTMPPQRQRQPMSTDFTSGHILIK
jgi:hypothetical protein